MANLLIHYIIHFLNKQRLEKRNPVLTKPCFMFVFTDQEKVSNKKWKITLSVKEFILLGLTDDPGLNVLIFLFLFCTYILSVTGNMRVITLTLVNLFCPMSESLNGKREGFQDNAIHKKGSLLLTRVRAFCCTQRSGAGSEKALSRGCYPKL